MPSASLTRPSIKQQGRRCPTGCLPARLGARGSRWLAGAGVPVAMTTSTETSGARGNPALPWQQAKTQVWRGKTKQEGGKIGLKMPPTRLCVGAGRSEKQGRAGWGWEGPPCSPPGRAGRQRETVLQGRWGARPARPLPGGASAHAGRVLAALRAPSLPQGGKLRPREARVGAKSRESVQLPPWKGQPSQVPALGAQAGQSSESAPGVSRWA